MQGITAASQCAENERENTRKPALEAPWLPEPEAVPDDEAQIEARALKEQAFFNVPPAAQVQVPHGTRFVHVRVAPLGQLSSFAVQLPAAVTSSSPPIRVHPRLLFVSLVPTPLTSIRFCYIAAYTQPVQTHQHVIAVIAFVRYHFLDLRSTRALCHRVRCAQRFEDARRISRIPRVHRDRPQRSAREIDRVLHLVCKTGPSIHPSSS